jgi:hypothetical protein
MQRSVLYLMQDVILGYLSAEPDISDNLDNAPQSCREDEDSMSGSLSGPDPENTSNPTVKPDIEAA